MFSAVNRHIFQRVQFSGFSPFLLSDYTPLLKINTSHLYMFQLNQSIQVFNYLFIYSNIFILSKNIISHWYFAYVPCRLTNRIYVNPSTAIAVLKLFYFNYIYIYIFESLLFGIKWVFNQQNFRMFREKSLQI